MPESTQTNLIEPNNIEKIIISDKRRNALVTSGGGLKGFFFHIGVGMRLEREGFVFKGGVLDEPRTELLQPGAKGNSDIDLYVSSSGGCLFNIGTALGHSAKDMYDLFMDDRKLRKVGLRRGVLNYVSLNPQILTQIIKSMSRSFGTRVNPESLSFMSPLHLGPLERRLHTFLEVDDFTKVASDLFVVCTPLNQKSRIVYCRKPLETNHRIVYRNDTNISTAVAASCSLQFFHPYCVEHKNGDKIDEVDGETRKTLSYRIASDQGADLVFVSYTHVPYVFNEKIGSIKKYGMIKTVIQSVYLLIEEKILASKESIDAKNHALDVIDEEFYKLIKAMPEHSKLLKTHQRRLIDRLVDELNIKRNVDYIFIHPQQEDHEFYFEWHLGMSKDYIERIVKKGYESADLILKQYEFRFKN